MGETSWPELVRESTDMERHSDVNCMMPAPGLAVDFAQPDVQRFCL
jgi:hypothetical protein